MVFALVGIACLIVTIRQYRRIGSVFCAAYFSLPKDERESLRTAKAYRYAGNVFLYLTMISFLVGASLIFDHASLALIGATLAASGVLGGIIFVVTQ